MQPFPSRPSRRSLFVLLAAGGLLAACDRHSADDLPESYGHGSSHEKSYERHETDSRAGGHHFSDSKGLSPDQEHDKAAPGPQDKPDTTDAGRLFPSPVIRLAPGAAPLYAMLSQIKLRDFRCYESLEVELTPGAQFFTGDNAQGKTSILEAVCVLLRLASPRSSTLAPLIRQDARGFALRGRWGTRQMQFYFNPERRKLALDGVEQTGTREFLRVARLVYFSNTDLELVRGSADARRRFLDFLGSQIEPLYRTNLRAYERALRSRNRLLKSYPVRRREVEAYDTPLLEAGQLLTRLRRSLVEELLPWAVRSQETIRASAATGAEEALTLEYQPGSGEDFPASLATSREEETRLRQTTVGPHRDDLSLRLGGQVAGVYGSEGQQRTLALALKLAQAGLIEAVWKQPPLLLLDDIFGELDPTRRNALFAALPAGAQMLVTTTHLDWLRDAPAGPVWQLSDRRLEPVPPA